MKTNWSICTMEYTHKSKKKKKKEREREGKTPLAAAWMDQDIILLSEVRDRKTNILKYYLQVEARNSCK